MTEKKVLPDTPVDVPMPPVSETLGPRDGKYLIWSNQHSAWWRPDSCGYTMLIEDAGRYSRTAAIGISRAAWRDHTRGKGVPNEIAVLERDVLEMAAR